MRVAAGEILENLELRILRFEINYKLMMYYIFFISTASDSSQVFSASFLISGSKHGPSTVKKM